jgi:hypothetical protein
MSLTRSYQLESQFEVVAAAMDLRRPQRDSLAVVHDIVRSLPASLRQLRASEIADRVRQMRPEWSFPASYASLTFALATGVGKTRLVGAIAAYLYRIGESQNFVILAPRDAILRKFEAEVREAAEKYLFVDPAIVPQPRVCHRGNLLNFRPMEKDSGFFPTGPNVFIFSPQLLVTQGRIAEPSEFAGSSIQDYLRTCGDLVVFVDESHHVSPREHDEILQTWGGAVSALEPKIVFEMTATPRPDAAVAHEYGLAQCLRERLYTKAVRMIVDEQGGHLSGDEYDAYTLRFAIDRLHAKEEALEHQRAAMPGFPQIRPVLLVSALNTKHADRIHQWLFEEAGFEEDEVLLIHSKSKTEDDMARLAAIERADSRVRAVVQVHVLDEGWDVTNVYVIAPLRNVNSYINARQMMGRGLRLPAARRVGHDEVDTLDLLAFGQTTFQDIYKSATAEFGDPDQGTGGVEVIRAGEGGSGRQVPTVQPEDEAKPATKSLAIALTGERKIIVPLLDMIPPEPVLDVSVDATGLVRGTRVGVELGTLEVSAVKGELRIARSRFLAIAVDQVFRDFTYLADPLHRERVLELVEDVVAQGAHAGSAIVGLDPVLCGKLVAEALAERYYLQEPVYRSWGAFETVELAPIQANVPLTFTVPPTQEAVRTGGWIKPKHFRLPIGGWKRCLHELAHFESRPEFEMAYRLDRMQGVDSWLRNDPGQLVVQTLAGTTRPDFVVWLEDGRLLLLEIKGEHLWEPKRSESWVRARDLRLWLRAANGEETPQDFEFLLVLGGEIDQINTLEDVFAADALSAVEA